MDCKAKFDIVSVKPKPMSEVSVKELWNSWPELRLALDASKRAYERMCTLRDVIDTLSARQVDQVWMVGYVGTLVDPSINDQCWDSIDRMTLKLRTAGIGPKNGKEYLDGR